MLEVMHNHPRFLLLIRKSLLVGFQAIEVQRRGHLWQDCLEDLGIGPQEGHLLPQADEPLAVFLSSQLQYTRRAVMGSMYDKKTKRKA
jgi:hypothetical protein